MIKETDIRKLVKSLIVRNLLYEIGLHHLTFQTPIFTALKIKKCNGEFHALPYLSSLKEYRRYLFFLFPKTFWKSKTKTKEK
jgi:hypothetical protein